MTVNFFGVIDNCVSINMRDVLQKIINNFIFKNKIDFKK